MALALSNLTSGATNADQATYTTASISPTNGDLILLSVLISGTKNAPPSISGAGLVFKLVTSLTAGTRYLSLYYANADGSATAGALTLTKGGGSTVVTFSWVVDKVTGHDSSSPIAWCVQASTNAIASGATSPATATLQTLQDTSSVAYGVLGEGATTAANLSPGSGFTQLAEQASTNNVQATEYKVNDASISWTAASGLVLYAAFGLEITASNTGARNNPLASHLLGCMGSGA